ncbi:MAG TPA: C13 family peptidase [Hyphomonadaceae bacterium]|nr:C13 family peptidase [Hyphomonadaceae bacterium]
MNGYKNWSARIAGAALSVTILAGAGPASAQQQQGPLPFGASEAAMPPGEALKQVEMMAQTLSQLQPQRPGVVDTYVLSASFYNDPVFESEAKEAAAVLARRYDAEGRTIILSAGRGTNVPRSYPAASPNNFQAALGKIGATIDPNEDLVIVFTTSHGGQDGTVALVEANRMQGGLRALNLRAALSQAGIRNKVIIVSACFSGHFILPFSADPGALVLTAAAADKTSFGCEPSRDWTYFGDALFNHALRGGDALVESYNEALDQIASWERDLHAKWEALPASQKKPGTEPLPSNPQSNVGEAVDALVTKAEAYGLAVNCAAHLSVAVDRAKAGRPLKGLSDWAALSATQLAVQGRAIAEGARRQRSTGDVAKAVAATAAGLLQLYNTQPADVTARTAKCAAPAP